MKSIVLHLFVTLLTSILFLNPGLSQWSNDYEVNTVINAGPGANYVPKIRYAPNGDFYVSWYGGSSNLNMNLQRLSFHGYNEWASNGIIVSNHPQNTWVTDYDLQVDTSGNAVLAFTDIREGFMQTVVYKISPDGEYLYGMDGIVPSVSTAEDFVPALAITSDNHTIVAWQRETENGLTTVVQKINADGSKPWGENGLVFNNENAEIQNPIPVATSDGGFLLIYYVQTGPFWSPDRKIYGQKYNGDGESIWPDSVEICGITGIAGFDVLQVSADGSNGAIVTWRDDSNGNTLSNVAVQHLKSDGSLAFPANGMVVGKDDDGSNNYGVIPGAISTSGDIFVFWTATNGSQSEFGLRGQKVAANGDLLWGENGVDFIPLNTSFDFPIGLALNNDTNYVVYQQHAPGSILDQQIMAKALTPDGEEIFDGDFELALSATEKGHADITPFINNMMAVCWEENGSPTSIKAQNLIVGDTSTTVPTGIGEPLLQAHLMQWREDHLYFTQPEQIEQVVVYDLNGRIVLRVNNPAQSKVIASENLPTGIFLAVAYGKSGMVKDRLRFYSFTTN